ncbi:aspartate/glutamate racemase family protein [Ignatzschineria rhizosphaerae]|uniref:Aspartate/glutamate racemase family protein n=1 Tax=Ignatzschineria rhizosphaerae TaxID=2923279 RepID=A0ABY3WWL9_9GAMM|nr:aspartate/glutamate racemase family protein [Ignatzschineria rhizosphaerae]UNM95004.1 aspartate/glutamate racemase family protein [Ignatzschineria rhizosphaerae]
MKKIGLIGGMSWESTALYYQWINREVQKRLGGLHSAKMIVTSVDFAEIEKMQSQGDWDLAAKVLADEAKALESAGADCVVLCTNTMHKLAKEIEDAISIPFIHVAKATGEAILAENITNVALLGTAFTMEQEFYKSRLEEMGISVMIPDERDRKVVHEIIYQELCRGMILESSKRTYCEIVEKLIAQGAQGVILGCTEITMLIGDVKFTIPTFDTTHLHALKAVDFSLQ